MFSARNIFANQSKTNPSFIKPVSGASRSPDEEKARIRREKAAQVSRKDTRSKKKRKPGRPKGSTNKNKRQIHWNEELHQVKRMASTLIERVHPLALRYLVLDGHFGTNNVMQMVRQSLSLHLISKLRHDSALYFLYEGSQKPVGQKRVYGAKIDYESIPSKYLVQTDRHEDIQTDIYQATMCHKSLPTRSTWLLSSRRISRRSRRHESFSLATTSTWPMTYSSSPTNSDSKSSSIFATPNNFGASRIS